MIRFYRSTPIFGLTDVRKPYFWPSKRGGDPSYAVTTLREHLKDASWYEPDVAAGNRYLETRAVEIQGVVKDAAEHRASDLGLPAIMHALNPDDALAP